MSGLNKRHLIARRFTIRKLAANHIGFMICDAWALLQKSPPKLWAQTQSKKVNFEIKKYSGSESYNRI